MKENVALTVKGRLEDNDIRVAKRGRTYLSVNMSSTANLLPAKGKKPSVNNDRKVDCTKQ